MLFLSALLACGPACFSQQAEKFPLGDYVELTDTKPHDGEEVWSKMTAPVRFCWGTTDVYNPQIQISAESGTKRSIFRQKNKTKRSKKGCTQHL